MKKAEAILKPLAIPDLCLKRHRLTIEWHLQFHCNDVADMNIAGNDRTQAAFAQIFGAAVQYVIFSAN